MVNALGATALLLLNISLLVSVAHGQGSVVTASIGNTRGNLSAVAAKTSSANAARLKQMADQWRLTEEEASIIGEPHGAGKMRICVDPFTPGVYCEPGETEQSKFGGYQVVLFEMISRDVPWLSDSQSWYYSCMPTHDVYDALVGKGVNGSCMMSTAAVPLLPALLERGIQPSWAIEKQGLLIMTTTDPDRKTGLWAPFAAFTWPVWVCLILTSIFVALVLWVFEMVAAYLSLPSKKEQQLARKLIQAQSGKGQLPHGGNKDIEDVEAADALAAGMVSMRGSDAVDGKVAGPKAPKMFSEDWYMLHFRTPKAEAVALLRDYLNRSGLKFVKMVDPPGVQTMAAYAVLFGYGLLLTIISCLYAASAAAMLTTMSLSPSITGVKDLKGKAVGTWDEYVAPIAQEIGVSAVPFAWDNKEDEERMLDALSSGMVSALVLDESFVRYLTARRCNFVAVGQPFQINDYGYGYNRRMQPELTEDMDRYLRGAVQLGLPERMSRLYIEEGPGCASASIVDATQGVRLSQVWGLWVVLAITIGLAGLCNAWQWLQRRKLRHAAKAAASKAATARSARSMAAAQRRASKQEPNGNAGGMGAGSQDSALANATDKDTTGPYTERAGKGAKKDKSRQQEQDGYERDTFQAERDQGVLMPESAGGSDELQEPPAQASRGFFGMG